MLQLWRLEEPEGRGRKKRGRRRRATEVGLESLLTKLKKNERIKEWEEFVTLQTKADQMLEADKLAKRNARPPETAVYSVATALQRHKSLQEKEQAMLVEVDEAAQKAAKAADEAKDKAVKRQEEIDRLQADYERERARLVLASESDSKLHTALRDTFHALSDHAEARTLFCRLGHGHVGGGHAAG